MTPSVDIHHFLRNCIPQRWWMVQMMLFLWSRRFLTLRGLSFLLSVQSFSTYQGYVLDQLSFTINLTEPPELMPLIDCLMYDSVTMMYTTATMRPRALTAYSARPFRPVHDERMIILRLSAT